MAKRKTKKEKAYQLFNEGKDASSSEVKALGLKPSSRYSYYSRWCAEGQPIPLSEPSPLLSKESQRKEKVAVKARTPLPGGEALGAISEVSEVKPREDKGESREEAEPKGTEVESKGDRVEVKKGDKALGSVIGEGLWASVNISVKTLALYQLAASMQNDELTLGDFLDTCVEDTYRGRGMDLGLISLKGG